ncbi:hypothetical protein D3C72_2044140 [compost metagenome]
MGIEAETNCARCETGFKSADKTLSPFGLVALAGRRGRSIVAVQIKVSVEHAKRRALEKSYGAFRRFLGQCVGGQQAEKQGNGRPEVLREEGHQWLTTGGSDCDDSL